jgi:hypothetical protein
MLQHSIASGVGFCRFDDCTIVLDIRRDRYWQLTVEAGEMLAKLTKSDSADIPDEQLDPLVGLGLLVAGPPAAEPAALPAPRRSLLEQVGRTAGGTWRDVLEIGWLVIATRAFLRFQRLDRVLARVQGGRRQTEHGNEALTELACRFEWARGLVPITPRCLPDTIAWLNFIDRRGHAAHLVFGVVSSPFQAHCWAQVGDTVHNDALDHARRFSPILII